MLEEWVSGLNQQFAKLPYGVNPYRGFKSLFLRHSKFSAFSFFLFRK